MTLLLFITMKDTANLWTIDELGAQVALALAAGYDGVPSGRIRDVPDLRTIRYYTTLGLLDRPAAMQGRTALYGRKHLWQLVAVKRLQTQGLTLVEIQQRLLGKTEKELASLAQVSGKTAPENRGSFWKREAPSSAPEKTPGPPGRAQEAGVPSAGILSLQGIPLREDVTLLFAPLRPLTPEDVQALQTAAGPLLKYLEKRRLTAPREKETP